MIHIFAALVFLSSVDHSSVFPTTLEVCLFAAPDVQLRDRASCVIRAVPAATLVPVSYALPPAKRCSKRPQKASDSGLSSSMLFLAVLHGDPFFLGQGTSCAFVVSKVQAMLLERFCDLGNGGWCQTRSYRDVAIACPVFQSGRQPDPVFPHLILKLCQSNSQSEGHRRLARALRDTVSHCGWVTASQCASDVFPW